LPDDYLVGMFMGDGSLELDLKFNSRIDYGFNFTTTLSKDSLTTLIAIKNKFGGKGSIRRTSKRGNAYQYYLESLPAFKQYVIALFDKFKMTYSKQRQLDIIKELISLVEKEEYKNETGAFRIVDLFSYKKIFYFFI
jgi:hypothetical protein